MTHRGESAETLERWLRVPDAIKKDIEGLTEDTLDLSGGSNGWSIQNVHHLVEANLVASNIVVVRSRPERLYLRLVVDDAERVLDEEGRVRHGTGGTSARDAPSAVLSYLRPDQRFARCFTTPGQTSRCAARKADDFLSTCQAHKISWSVPGARIGE